MTQPNDKNNETHLTLLPTTKKIDLHNSHAIRRELGSVYRDMRNGNVEMADGTKLGYMLNLMLKAYETCELEKKLEAIEGQLQKR